MKIKTIVKIQLTALSTLILIYTIQSNWFSYSLYGLFYFL